MFLRAKFSVGIGLIVVHRIEHKIMFFFLGKKFTRDQLLSRGGAVV
jgi:hypothetical protein